MRESYFFCIHSFAGLVSGLFIFLMSFSGATLVFHDELDVFQIPDIITDQRKLATVDSCYHSIQKYYPNAQISNCGLPENYSKPFSFFIYDSSYKNGTAVMEVFLHPQSALILKTRGGNKDIQNNFMSWLSKFHSSFHLGKAGEWLLGFFSLIFSLSIISGFILFRKNILDIFLFRKTAYKSNNLHQLVGVYALLFNLMIAITGFWMQRYVFKNEFYHTDYYTRVLKTSPPLSFSFDAAYSAIKKAYPDFTSGVIYFAQGNKGMTAVYGSRSSNSFIHSKKMADVIFLDSTGSISKTRFVNEIDAADRYDIINAQLHIGKYGGLPLKIIYSLFGLTGGLLSITGFLLWIKGKRLIKI